MVSAAPGSGDDVAHAIEGVLVENVAARLLEEQKVIARQHRQAGRRGLLARALEGRKSCRVPREIQALDHEVRVGQRLMQRSRDRRGMHEQRELRSPSQRRHELGDAVGWHRVGAQDDQFADLIRAEPCRHAMPQRIGAAWAVGDVKALAERAKHVRLMHSADSGRLDSRPLDGHASASSVPNATRRPAALRRFMRLTYELMMSTSWTSESRYAIIGVRDSNQPNVSDQGGGRVIEHRTRSEHSRARSEHTHSRARRATTRLLAARAVVTRPGTVIGAKAAALTPDVDLSTPLRVTTTATLTPTLLDAIALPLRAAHGLRAIAGAVLRIPALADAVGDLRSELVGLRADLSGMPADSRRLADDVEVVHEELRVMQAELVDVKASVAPVHGDLARVEAGLAPLPDQLDRLLPKIDELSGRLDEMRGELAEQLDGMRTDLSGLPFVSKSS